MNRTSLLLIVALLLSNLVTYGATKDSIRWINPQELQESIIEGQGWPKGEIDTYSRLPPKAESTVRGAVWGLSRNSAGLSIRIRTNSESITVRYKVSGNLSMPHMPTTGVSGVDIYAKDSGGAWSWCRGKYSLSDTITYSYNNINCPEPYHNQGREYRVYLPLYNSVEFLEIGTPKDKTFEIIPLREEKPIVVYGTSIAQGACASRPGMAWTSILSRKLDRPIINLGFSGNGRLESEVVDLISEIDAKLYIFDCLPNMMPRSNFTIEDADFAYDRVVASVKELREQRADAPILLVEHSGYSDGELNRERFTIYSELNKAMKRAYTDLLRDGVTNIYLLPRESIHLNMDSYVDGTHPSDLGMMQYADAYEKSVRAILHQSSGAIATVKPVTQLREPSNYDWEQRHQTILKLNREDPPEICFFGNSIVHYWAGEPKANMVRGEEAWEEIFKSKKVRNFGFGWDRVENILWRVNHDELDGFQAEHILLMLGTNNIGRDSNEDIVAGIDLLVKTVKQKQPNSKITVIGVLPRRGEESRIRTLNNLIAQTASLNGVRYTDIGGSLLNMDSATTETTINEKLFSDGLHPNEAGYNSLIEALKSIID